ncbi:MAG: hypothetical protein GWO24_09700 [Akkermansiaceae bacterium]|nr:hypothetical protein [Akkermansiaceae bacterium]
MAEEGEEDKAGVGHLGAAAPGSVLALGVLHPAQGFHDRLLALFVATVLLEALEAVFLGTALAHDGRDVSEAAAAAVSARSPTGTEIIPASEIEIGFRIGLRDRHGGGGRGGGGDHLRHRGGRGGWFALNLRVDFLLVEGVFVRQPRIVTDDHGRIDHQALDRDVEEHEDDQGDGEDCDRQAGDRRVPFLGLEAGFRFGAELGV